MGASFTNRSRNTYPYTNSYSDCNTHSNANSNSHADSNGYVYANAYSYAFSHGYPDALFGNRSGLCRRENSKRAGHLAECRIQYDDNHKWAAGAYD